MYYVTALTAPHYTVQNDAALRAVQFLYGLLPEEPELGLPVPRDYPRTFTRCVERESLPSCPPQYAEWFTPLLLQIATFLRDYPDRDDWYTKFFIPKASGGFREINAPIDPLKDVQRQVVHRLSHIPGFKLPVVHAHDCAYAYIEKRSTKHALMEHQHNGSNWFLKLDIRDFFPSCTKDVVVNTLKSIYPLCYIGDPELRMIVDICCLQDALPQGAPSSPFLTNILMIPIDKAINDYVFNLNRRRHVYTRYADDLLISSRESFNWQEIQSRVQEILQPYGFRLKIEKTHYGSRAGRNWNLGIMLNKDNNLSLGHKHKQRMRAAVFSFLKDFITGNPWPIDQTQILVGQLSYLESIEPAYKQYIIQHYEEKLGMSFSLAVHTILN